MKLCVFIFAGGNSKGLPGKNIKLLNGKPLIVYSIEMALKIPSVDKVFVSTEDKHIAKISKLAGAVIIDRPHSLAKDKTPEWKAWKHAIKWVNKKFGEFKIFISLPTTSPLRTLNDIKRAISKKSKKNADICLAVTPASHSPYFNMVKKSKNNFVKLANKTKSNIFRRQDAPKLFYITTTVYVLDAKFIMNNNNMFDGKITSIEVPKNRAVDIDDIHDFNFVESILYNNLSKEKKCY